MHIQISLTDEDAKLFTDDVSSSITAGDATREELG